MQLRDNIVKIEFDETGWLISKDDVRIKFGDYYHHLRDQHNLLRFFYEGSVVAGKYLPYTDGVNRFRTSGTKEFNKRWSDFLGMPISLWRKRFNKMMYDHYVKPVEEYGYLFRCYSGEVDNGLLCKVTNVKSILDQTIEDGNKHLTPFVVRYQADLPEIKKILGKSLWKKVCRQSMSRNLYLSRKMGYFATLWGISAEERDRQNLSNLIWAPSYYLKHDGVGLSPEAAETFLKSGVGGKNQPLRTREWARWVNIVVDTDHMANRLGEPFNIKWSMKKMNEKHEEYTKKIELREYSKDPFPFEPLTIEKEVDGVVWKAESLNSAYEVREEGIRMKHCVADYAECCHQGDYVVFSIKKNGEHYSTLGIKFNIESFVPVCDDAITHYSTYKISPLSKWGIDQHYMACNEYLEDDLSWLEAEVLSKLNVNTAKAA